MRIYSLILKFGILLLMGFMFYSCGQKPEPDPMFRNVVVIISDDHAQNVTRCYGNDIVRTPNIDRIASGGTRFANAYANAPICSASRQSLLTGKYPHATGVNLLFTPFNDEMNLTVAEQMQSAGIATALVGKNHWNDWVYGDYWDEWPSYGFDTVITRANWAQYMKHHPATFVPASIPTRANSPHMDDIAWQKNAQMLPAPYYDGESSGTFLATSAIDFIRHQGDSRFFLWVAFHEPHAPFNFPVEYAGSYDPDSLPLPEGSREDQRWVPGIFKDLNEEERRGIVASYYTSVEYMDKNVGLILDELKSSGVGEQTLVVYLSDHGYLLNDHSRFEKHSMWEEAIKAPLIFQGRGVSAASVQDELVEFVDLAPTILEAMGIDLHDELQGHSLIPLITGEGKPLREYAFCEYLEDNMAMVSSKKWKYVFTTGKRDLGLGYATGKGPSGVVHMLYDLEIDPMETTNLAYTDEYHGLVDSLQRVMLDKFLETHPHGRFVPSGLNTTGKLIWFCEPNDVGDEPGTFIERIFEEEDAKIVYSF